MNEDKTRNQRASGRQARAMTRAIDMVSEEFIESFSQTGKDDGPETPAKQSPVREALAARERREEEEMKQAEAKPAFKGFGALLAGASSAENDAVVESPAAAEPVAGVQTNADGSVIKRKDTSGKKRGLYTSWMQKPTAEQIQDAAVKYSRPESRAQAAPPEAMQEITPVNPPAAISEPVQPSPFARPTAAPPPAPVQRSPMGDTEPSPMRPRARANSETTHSHSRPLPTKITEPAASSCPIACAFGEFGQTCRRFFGWFKSIFEK